MILTVEAVDENGILKLMQPLPLKEQEKVRITIVTEITTPEQAVTKLPNLGYDLMGWTGDAETVERIALDPEFLPEEAP